MRRGGPQNRSVSGFILASNVSATHLNLTQPEVWLNLWTPPKRRFEARPPWTHVHIDADTGVLTREPADFDPLAFFGLPDGWCGFGRPPRATMPLGEYIAWAADENGARGS